MNKLRLKSNYLRRNLNPCHLRRPRPGNTGIFARAALILVILLTLNIGPVRAQSCQLQVTVKNHRCPACFVTLKKYLLEMQEVQSVTIKDGGTKKSTALITVKVRSAAGVEAVLERIKARDLEILSKDLQTTGQ